MHSIISLTHEQVVKADRLQQLPKRHFFVIFLFNFIQQIIVLFIGAFSILGIVTISSTSVLLSVHLSARYAWKNSTEQILIKFDI
jgi:hypothetical protein